DGVGSGDDQRERTAEADDGRHEGRNGNGNAHGESRSGGNGFLATGQGARQAAYRDGSGFGGFGLGDDGFDGSDEEFEVLGARQAVVAFRNERKRHVVGGQKTGQLQ